MHYLCIVTIRIFLDSFGQIVDFLGGEISAQQGMFGVLGQHRLPDSPSSTVAWTKHGGFDLLIASDSVI